MTLSTLTLRDQIEREINTKGKHTVTHEELKAVAEADAIPRLVVTFLLQRRWSVQKERALPDYEISAYTFEAISFPGRTCEEAHTFLSKEKYVPCGKMASVVVYHECDAKSYYMCSWCAEHNIHNRGGTPIAFTDKPR